MIAPRDMVIVKVVYKEKIGSLVIAETFGGKENTQDYYGEVVSIGPLCPFRGQVKEGEKIMFHRNEGIKVKDENGNEFISLKPRAVLGVYDEV